MELVAAVFLFPLRCCFSQTCCLYTHFSKLSFLSYSLASVLCIWGWMWLSITTFHCGHRHLLQMCLCPGTLVTKIRFHSLSVSCTLTQENKCLQGEMMDLHLSGYCGGKSPIYIVTDKFLKTSCDYVSLVAADLKMHTGGQVCIATHLLSVVD